jgi:ribosome-binding factor A
MSGRRIARLNEQLKREIAGIIQNEVKDPRIGTVTITAVDATADLDQARVYFTSPVSGEERAELLEGLDAAATFVRAELGRRLRVRRIPALHFVWDDTLEHAMHIERLLASVRPPDKSPDDDDATGEDADD